MRAVDAAAVELVIPGHVENGLRETRRPGNRLARPGDVARQDDDVGVVSGPLERLEAEMQIRQDIQFHGSHEP